MSDDQDVELIRYARDEHLRRAERRVLSEVRHYREWLDLVERSVTHGRATTAGNSTATESLLDAIARWDALIELFEDAGLLERR